MPQNSLVQNAGSRRSSESESLVAQNPLILRCHRLMEAFAKSNDEREFYLDRLEGFLVYVDLDKSEEEISELMHELERQGDRYVSIPKLTFYEIKKVMEGFVNEKVYDIDTKEKLLDIIQSKEARENFLEFIYDHHNEMEKWQQYYQERFRIRIIEWLRNFQFDFVFEEDLDLTKSILEKVRMSMFDPKAGKDVLQARKLMAAKAKTYYSNEALNPRPKRGRPPKQVVKVETEPQFSTDIYVSVPKVLKPFLFTPDYRSSAAVYIFSGKFTSEAELLAHRRQQLQSSSNFEAQSITQKLSALRALSSTMSQEELESEHSSFELEEMRNVAQQVEAGRQAVKKALESKKNDSSKNDRLESKPVPASKKPASLKSAKQSDVNSEPLFAKSGSKASQKTISRVAPLKSKSVGDAKSSKSQKGAPANASQQKAGAKKTVSAKETAKKTSSTGQKTPIKKETLTKTAPKTRLRPLPTKKAKKK